MYICIHNINLYWEAGIWVLLRKIKKWVLRNKEILLNKVYISTLGKHYWAFGMSQPISKYRALEQQSFILLKVFLQFDGLRGAWMGVFLVSSFLSHLWSIAEGTNLGLSQLGWLFSVPCLSYPPRSLYLFTWQNTFKRLSQSAQAPLNLRLETGINVTFAAYINQRKSQGPPFLKWLQRHIAEQQGYRKENNCCHF